MIQWKGSHPTSSFGDSFYKRLGLLLRVLKHTSTYTPLSVYIDISDSSLFQRTLESDMFFLWYNPEDYKKGFRVIGKQHLIFRHTI